jgi:outer membrane protein OmpU
MNNLKKIGISALAGSLATFSAHAVDMSVAGSAKVTYYSLNGDEVTGNPYGMNTSLAFSGSGDVNGYETTLTIVNNDANSGLSSASLAVDLGDMGKVTFDQGVGVGGLSTIDDKLPSAYEESWDSIDAAATTSSNGLVGMGNSGVFVYSNEVMGSNLSAQFGKGQSVANTDDAVGGVGGHGSSWDFALTNSSLYDGMTVGFGYGKIANGNGAKLENSEDEDEHMTAFVTYSTGPVTVGVQQSNREDNSKGGIDEEAFGYGISINLMEGVSVSYAEREIDFRKPSATDKAEDGTGLALSYTVGSAKVAVQHNESKNNDGGTTNDESTEIALSLAF